jgi:hypothetical protein
MNQKMMNQKNDLKNDDLTKEVPSDELNEK